MWQAAHLTVFVPLGTEENLGSPCCPLPAFAAQFPAEICALLPGAAVRGMCEAQEGEPIIEWVWKH